MGFFKQLDQALKEGDGVSFSIHKKDGKLGAVIRPMPNLVDKDFQNSIQPMSVKGTADEFDEELVVEMVKVIEISSSIAEEVNKFEEDIKAKAKAKTEKKENKKKAEETKKELEQEKLSKRVSEIIKLADGFKKLKQFDNALKNYNKAQDVYKEENDGKESIAIEKLILEVSKDDANKEKAKKKNEKETEKSTELF